MQFVATFGCDFLTTPSTRGIGIWYVEEQGTGNCVEWSTTNLEPDDVVKGAQSALTLSTIAGFAAGVMVLFEWLLCEVCCAGCLEGLAFCSAWVLGCSTFMLYGAFWLRWEIAFCRGCHRLSLRLFVLQVFNNAGTLRVLWQMASCKGTRAANGVPMHPTWWSLWRATLFVDLCSVGTLSRVHTIHAPYWIYLSHAGRTTCRFPILAHPNPSQFASNKHDDETRLLLVMQWKLESIGCLLDQSV